MKRLGKGLGIFLTVVGSVLFFWLIGLKLLRRLWNKIGLETFPCPSALGIVVDNPVRRRAMAPVLDRLDLQQGETVLELGPGPGAFTVEAARRVAPVGRLVAVDIQPAMIEKVQKRVNAAGISNVLAQVGSAYELPLPDGSVDRAFAVTVMPEIPDPERALLEIYRVLKPGGLFSVTEEFGDPDYPRMETSVRWAETAGFELEERYGNWWQYTLNFRKPRVDQTSRASAYYILRRPALLKDFDRMAAQVRPALLSHYGEATDRMIAETRREYSILIPALPYIGTKPPLNQLVVATGWYVAMYRVIRRREGTAEEAGQLFYELAEDFLRRTPALARQLMGKVAFTDPYRRQLQAQALESKKRTYPADYVFNYVEGDGKSFDFGLDYLRCTSCEFLKAQGAMELAPYLCRIEALYCEMLGLGLRRTKTLAAGDSCCNFRFKAGRKPEPEFQEKKAVVEPSMPAVHKPKLMARDLSDVSETMLFTLYLRAKESQEPRPILRDPQAMEMVRRIEYNFSRFDGEKLDQAGVAVRQRKFDRAAREFLARNPEAIVISLGCGLDTRFSRVDNGQLTWFDLDLPPVIELRRKLIDETPRQRMLAYSVLDPVWMRLPELHTGKPVLLIAEGLFFFFDEETMKKLFLDLEAHFPGAELLFDGQSPFAQRVHNLQMKLAGRPIRFGWGIKSGKEMELWGPGIRLLEEWYFVDDPEPRMGILHALAGIPAMRKSVVFYRYKLNG